MWHPFLPDVNEALFMFTATPFCEQRTHRRASPRLQKFLRGSGLLESDESYGTYEKLWGPDFVKGPTHPTGESCAVLQFN